MKSAFVLSLGLLTLSGCNPSESGAIGACETFIKARLRSPSTYRRISSDGLGPAFKNEGRNVKMITVEYDAANAYGTPIRGSQQCVFEVDDSGEFVEDLNHAARMSSIRADSEYAPCCLLNNGDKISGKTDADLMKVVDEADKAADAALKAADEASNAARKVLAR